MKLAELAPQVGKNENGRLAPQVGKNEVGGVGSPGRLIVS